MCNRFDENKKRVFKGFCGDSVIIGVFPKYHPIVLAFVRMFKPSINWVLCLLKLKTKK